MYPKNSKGRTQTQANMALVTLLPQTCTPSFLQLNFIALPPGVRLVVTFKMQGLYGCVFVFVDLFLKVSFNGKGERGKKLAKSLYPL